MGRSHVSPIIQETEVTCGPASIKHTLAVFGKRKSLTYLTDLCKTSRNGTSTKNMISAITSLGFSVLAMENATLRHLISSLKYPPQKPRAVLVSYLYADDIDKKEWKDSGHWAMVSTYNSSDGRVVLFDSYYGKKKSYLWKQFKTIWKDYDLTRRRVISPERQYKLVRKWQHRLLLVVTKEADNLPNFRQSSVSIHTPLNA